MSKTAQKAEPLNKLRAIVSARDLKRALALAARATGRKPPVLNCAKLMVGDGVLSITTTDMDNEITVSVPLVDSGAAGEALVPMRELSKIASAVGSGNIELSHDATSMKMNVTCGATSYSLSAGVPVSDFPHPKTAGDHGHAFALSAESLRGLIGKTRHAISTEEARYYLNGIYLHLDGFDMCAVATDGHRLVVAKMPCPEEAGDMPGVIIPRKTINILWKISKSPAPVHVAVDAIHNRIRFVSGNVTLASKLIDGTYPDYAKVIPKEREFTVGFDAAALLAVVKRVGACCDRRDLAGMRFDFTLGECKASVESAWGHAEETFGCGYTDPSLKLTIGFNRRYLADMLKVIGPNIQAAIDDAASAVVWSNPDDPSLTCVIMPMRVV